MIVIRKLEDRFRFYRLIHENVRDTRQDEKKKFPLSDLLRQSVYIRLPDYEDLNDATRVSTDPGPCLLGSRGTGITAES